MAFCPTIFDSHIVAFDETNRVETTAECSYKRRVFLKRSRIDEPDHWRGLLLRTRSEGPRDRRAAKKRNEFAAFHSITSSARPSSGSGMVKPSVFAVLRLMISSIFVACCTGRSAGLSPFRIRPA